MANQSKKSHPPTSKSVGVSNKIAPIIEAFSVGSEKAAKKLIRQSAEAIYSENSVIGGHEVTSEHVEEVYSLMCSLKPADTLEALYCSQIVVSHITGMKKLSQSCSEDKALGLRMLRFAGESIERLEKKRNGGQQAINVTYNNIGPSQQALIAKGEGKDAGKRG